ncbi:MAG: SDR family oxidoreductase [Gammaproteobacteria bacterium]|nr:SDR family oxidoreductase [Gammaproteobacteria bacterium]
MRLFDLSGRVAIVTGGGSGLGRSFAMALAQAGADVALCARRRDKLAESARLLADTGRRVACVGMDVTDEASIASALAEVTDTLGVPDILVNNAGINRPMYATQLTMADWDAIVDTNLRGAFMTAQAFAKQPQRAGRGGSIVNVASILGIRAQKSVAAYMASKAGLIHLTHALALEWARMDIRVNALLPGYFRTDITTDFLDTEEGRKLVAHIPMRRPGNLQELTGPLLLLASPAGSFMTGTVVIADGGHLLSSL